MDQKKLLTSCSCITSRADTDAVTPRVINKVHIGLQFEYIISKRFRVSKTLFHSAQNSKVNKFNKQ